MTGPKMWRVDWREAGTRCCTKPRRKPFRLCASSACPWTSTLEELRQLVIAHRKDAFRQIIQGETGRLEARRERVKNRGQFKLIGQTVIAGRPVTGPSHLPVILQTGEAAPLGPGTNAVGKNAREKERVVANMRPQ